MKTILSIVFVIGIALGAFSQSFPMTVTGNPVTNTGTGSAVIKMSQTYATVSIQANIASVSGTIAGTVTLMGSLDGVTYVTVPTAYTVAGVSTYTATNVASQAAIFTIKNSPYLYYSVSYVGSGTMSATLSGIAFGSAAK